MAITAINVFIEVDGKQHIAPIRADAADLFMGMLGAFQKDEKHRATLIPLHEDVSEHLIATRRALLKRIEAQREPQPWPRADPKALAAFDPATKVCSHNCGRPWAIHGRKTNASFCATCAGELKRSSAMGSDTPAHIQAGVPPLPWHMYQPQELLP